MQRRIQPKFHFTSTKPFSPEPFNKFFRILSLTEFLLYPRSRLPAPWLPLPRKIRQKIPVPTICYSAHIKSLHWKTLFSEIVTWMPMVFTSRLLWLSKRCFSQLRQQSAKNMPPEPVGPRAYFANTDHNHLDSAQKQLGRIAVAPAPLREHSLLSSPQSGQMASVPRR